MKQQLTKPFKAGKMQAIMSNRMSAVIITLIIIALGITAMTAVSTGSFVPVIITPIVIGYVVRMLEKV